MQRLFHPVHGLGFESLRHNRGMVDIPRALRIPRHSPTLIAVDHQLKLIAHRVANGADDRKVLIKTWPPKAHLQRWESQCDRLTCHLHHLGHRAVHATRRIGTNAITRATDHLPDRLIANLARKIPQRYVHRPRTTSMKLDVREHRRMTIEIKRILPDEVTLIIVEAVHRIARADSAIALIVEHPHDGRRKLGAWLGVPRCREHRVEWQLMMGDLNARNCAHVSFVRPNVRVSECTAAAPASVARALW